MKRPVLASLFCLAVLTAILSLGCRSKKEKSDTQDSSPEPERPLLADKAPAADIKAVALGNNAFAFDMHRQLGGAGNLFFSPFSIETALGMTYAGARGDTATEMAKTLRYPFEGERLHLGFAGLLGKLSGDGKPAGVQLRVANSLWGPEEYKKEFLDINRDCYAATVRKIQLVGAEPIINKWVEEQTAQRIKDLLPPNVLTPESLLVLVNAVYFKGQWKSQFKASATDEQEFRVKPGQTVKAKMMHQTVKLKHTRTGKGKRAAQVLELPYKGGDLAMVVILPEADDGLAEVEKTLTAEKLEDWLKEADATKVEVSLPRFKIAGGTISLKKLLIALGMKKAFKPGADFSGMVSGGAWIDEVLHKAFVEVNEEGSEAAAATAVIMKKEKGPERERTVEFKADHPFLFLIRDNRSGCILFQGRLSNPVAK